MVAQDGGCLSGTTPFQVTDFLSPNYRTRVIDTPCLAASERTRVTAGAGVARGAVEASAGIDGDHESRVW